MSRRAIRFWSAAAVAVVAARALLPSLVKAALQRGLHSMKGYEGVVKDVDLAVLQGGVRLNDVRLWETNARGPLLLRAERVGVDFSWAQLLRGRFVASVDVRNPVLWLSEAPPVPAPPGASTSAAAQPSWSESLRRLLPAKIERLRVTDGALFFDKIGSEPPVLVRVEDLDAEASNLTNSLEVSDSLFADVKATARVMGRGRANLALKVNPLSAPPTFDMDFELKELQLQEFNAFFKAYGSVDVQEGTFSMAGEAAVRKGKVTGYVRPALENVKVLSWKQDVLKEKDSPLQLLWEGLAETVKNVFKRVDPDQAVATRIPLDGTISDPKTDLATAALNVLRNAFLEAILPRLEHSVKL